VARSWQAYTDLSGKRRYLCYYGKVPNCGKAQFVYLEPGAEGYDEDLAQATVALNAILADVSSSPPEEGVELAILSLDFEEGEDHVQMLAWVSERDEEVLTGEDRIGLNRVLRQTLNM
jgi:hypothetical protein